MFWQGVTGKVGPHHIRRLLIGVLYSPHARTRLLKPPLLSRDPKAKCFASHTATRTIHDSVNLDGLVHRLAIFLRAGNRTKISVLFQEFMKDPAAWPTSTSTTANPRQVIAAALESLASDEETELLDRILQVMPEGWNMEVGPDTHEAILRGFQEHGHCAAALSWLLTAPNKPGSFVPRIEHWNAFLDSCSRRTCWKEFWDGVSHLRSDPGVYLTEDTYRLIFTHSFKGRDGASISAEIQMWVRRMRQSGVTFTRSLLDTLLDACLQAKAVQFYQEVESIFIRAPHAERKQEFCAESLASAIRSGDDRLASSRLTRYQYNGFVPTPATLEVIAGASYSPATLHKWGTRLGLKASPKAWENLMRNMAAGQRKDLLETYRAYVRSGRVPTALMLHPVLRAYCSRKLRPATEADIAEAVQLFREYTSITSTIDSPIGRPMPLAQEDVPLYNTLLRALIHSRSISHLFTAMSLLEELRARDIEMDNMTTTSYLILLMKVARDTQEAYRMYQLLHKKANGKYILDQRGYVAVISAYCKLSGKYSASTAHYMTMIKDMRAAGHDIPAQVYTIVLQQIALWARDVPRNDHSLVEHLEDSIKRVHHALTLDPTLVPDTALWNQLMDTYQRAGCLRDAFNIWDVLYAGGRYDNASVSIILDACAFSGYIELARHVLRGLQHAGFVLNERNWGTWIECLCRHKLFDEALQVLSDDMPRAGVRPTLNTARLVLRFAKGTSVEWNVHDRMKRVLPEMYAQITPVR